MGTWTSARNEVHIVQVKTQILLFFLVYSSTKVFYLKVFSIKRMRDGGRYIILLIFVLGKSLAQEDGEVAPGAKLGQNLGAVDSNAKLGQNKGLNVTCGKWTTRLVTVSKDTISYVWADLGEAERCTVVFKPTYDCAELCLYCPKFYVPNDDAYKCTKGSAFHTIADQTPVRDFCKRQGPDVNFPVLAMDAIKMWYVKDKGYDGSFACEVRCSQPA